MYYEIIENDGGVNLYKVLIANGETLLVWANTEKELKWILGEEEGK